MFGLDKISFLICLGVTLLLTGLIIFFMRQKFAVYDRHITEQSQLLKHLVAKLENNIHTTNAMLAAPSAIAAAKEAHKQFGQNGGHVLSNSKIIVSDDEDTSESESEGSDDDASSTSEDDSEVSEIDADNLNVQCKQIKLDELTYGSKYSGDEHHISLNDIDNVGETKTINLNTLDDLDVDENSDMNTDTDDSEDDDDDDDDIDIEDDERSSEKLPITRTEAKLTVYHADDDNASDIIEVNELNSTEQNYSDSSLNNTLSLKQILLDEDSEIKISNGKNKNNKKNNDINDSKDNQYLEFLETNDDPLKLNDMKLPQLKELCKSRNLSTNGNKKELIERLINK
jgi:hypothetical protein